MNWMNPYAPGASADAEGRAANRYDLSDYDGFPKMGKASQQLQRVAMSVGLRTLRSTWSDLSVSDSAGRSISFDVSFSEASSPVSGVITANKQLTRQFLEAAEAPVPPGRTFRMHETEEALKYASVLGYPVVVKPLSGKSGMGVSANIHEDQDVRWAVEQIVAIQGGHGRFIVEKHIDGQDYRIYVAYGEVLSVVLRTPASVMGDGIRTVSQLVEAKNELRGQNPHTRTRLIQVNDTTSYQLAKQNLDWESVPQAGHRLKLAAAANISLGGDSTEVLPETHPTILTAAVRGASAIPGLSQAGVDFLLNDHRKPLNTQGGGICEINATPALMANQAPVFGEVQPVVLRLVRSAAKASGLHVTEPRRNVRIAVRAQGVRDPENLEAWLVHHAHRLGLGGRTRAVGMRYVRAHLMGPVDRVSALVASMHSGRLSDRPDWVRTIPTIRRMPSTYKEVSN